MNLGKETERTEFKKTTGELKEGVASIASILNKHGSGTLYFGVLPSGEVRGQEVSESTLRDISQVIGSSIEPRIVPIIETLSDNVGHDYVRVMFHGDEAPYACKGTYRIRSADEDVVMTAAQLESMMEKRIDTKRPWDSRPSSRPITDIDEHTLRAYVERGNARERIPFEFTNVKDVLSRLDLFIEDKLTNTADVLFCPSRDVQLKMGILATHARTDILDLHQEEGTVFALVDKAASYILNNTRRRFVINDRGPRDEIPELPVKAIKEALMNAYAHRDWTSAGSVQVDIFSDAVEILSPGWFIEGQNPDEHLSGKSTSSKSRNKLIVKTLFRSGDIESYGTGIPRIKDLCTEVGVEIEYAKTSDGTKLIFHRNDAFAGESASNSQATSDKRPIMSDKRPITSGWDHLSSNEKRVCEFMQENGSVKTTQIAGLLEITQRSALRTLQKLVDLGIVEPHGFNRNRTYSLK